MKGLYKHLPFLSILVVWFIFSHPYFLFGKVPYPSSYQVNNFSPWSSYEKFWGPVKNGAMPDIITQIYPWRYFTIESWKNGQIPLWNPYSFSGTPHLANYQSAVFSPLNVLFFLPLTFIDAWSILVLLQPLFAGIFMYLFVRSLRVSSIGALISSTSFMFCGFVTTWMGYGTLSLAISILPLALFAIEKYFQTQQLRYLWLLGLSIPFSFFTGHFQTSLYFLLFVIAYIVFKFMSTKNVSNSLFIILYSLFGLLIAMPQILPSIELYSQSVRSTLFQKGEVIPWAYLPTLLAPDFFGNSVTRNDWLGHYAEWNAYVGVLPFLLAFYAILRKRAITIIFFLIASLISIFLAFDTPLLDLLFKLQIPVLATSAASRIIVLFSFSAAVLSGFGFDQLLADLSKKKLKPIILWTVICSILYILLWSIVIFKLFLPVDKVGVAKSNLVLPTVLFLSGLIPILFLTIASKRKFMILYSLFIILVVSLDMLRFATKWMPFDQKDHVFAHVSVVDEFSKLQGFDRALGNYEAGIATYYHLPSVEGYDPLYIGRYGEFVASLNDGKVKQSYRSVVNFPRNGLYSLEAVDFLGIKYIAHKTSDNYVGWTFPVWNNPAQFKKLFDDRKYQVFENTKAFSRAFLVGKFKVVTDKQTTIDTMFGKDFDLGLQVVLEQDPKLEQQDVRESNAKVSSDTPNVVNIETQSDQEAILVLTDNFYPGWRGYVDAQNVPILRADYTFRAVVVPKGLHKVKFMYQPFSFQLGLYTAFAGIAGLIVLSFSRGVKLIHSRSGNDRSGNEATAQG